MARTSAPSGTTSGRPTRTPVNGRNILSVKGKEDGFMYRFVNDTGDRIAAFQDAGYELVDASTVRVGDKRVNATTAEGTKAQVSVGKGDKAFLMRIKQEWFDEDQITKQTEVNRLEESIKQNVSKAGDYGSVSITHGTP